MHTHSRTHHATHDTHTRLDAYPVGGEKLEQAKEDRKGGQEEGHTAWGAVQWPLHEWEVTVPAPSP